MRLLSRPEPPQPPHETSIAAMLDITIDLYTGDILSISVHPFDEIDDQLNEALFKYLSKIETAAGQYPLDWEG